MSRKKKKKKLIYDEKYNLLYTINTLRDVNKFNTKGKPSTEQPNNLKFHLKAYRWRRQGIYSRPGRGPKNR